MHIYSWISAFTFMHSATNFATLVFSSFQGNKDFVYINQVNAATSLCSTYLTSF